MGSENAATGVPSSAVAWPAIIAGALAATSISLILLILGNGLGLTTVSPWGDNPSPVTFTVMTAIWLIFMQWSSAAVGAYITGRLRNRFAPMQSDEIFFRDTAHGFLTWSVATFFTVAFLTSFMSAVVGGSKHLAAAADDTKTGSPISTMGLDYEIDKLFRSDDVGNLLAKKLVRSETLNILNRNIKKKIFPEEDKIYISQLVQAYTGISDKEAYIRVNTLITQANELKEGMETARKAGVSLSIFTSLSLVIGAFIACVTAVLGGKHRDEL